MIFFQRARIMNPENILENCVMHGGALIVKNCSGTNMQSLVEIFNYLSFTKLHFVNSDIKDSDVKNLNGINKVDHHLLHNCPNITGQGLIKLVQIIKPKSLVVSYCPNIINDDIQKCKDIINAEPRPSPEPKPASSLNESTTICANKGERNSVYL